MEPPSLQKLTNGCFPVDVSEPFADCFQVIRRLRERGEPIRLFGETDYDAFQRLRKIEILAPEVNKVREIKCGNDLYRSPRGNLWFLLSIALKDLSVYYQSNTLFIIYCCFPGETQNDFSLLMNWLVESLRIRVNRDSIWTGLFGMSMLIIWDKKLKWNSMLLFIPRSVYWLYNLRGNLKKENECLSCGLWFDTTNV